MKLAQDGLLQLRRELLPQARHGFRRTGKVNRGMRAVDVVIEPFGDGMQISIGMDVDPSLIRRPVDASLPMPPDRLAGQFMHQVDFAKRLNKDPRPLLVRRHDHRAGMPLEQRQQRLVVPVVVDPHLGGHGFGQAVNLQDSGLKPREDGERLSIRRVLLEVGANPAKLTLHRALQRPLGLAVLPLPEVREEGLMELLISDRSSLEVDAQDRWLTIDLHSLSIWPHFSLRDAQRARHVEADGPVDGFLPAAEFASDACPNLPSGQGWIAVVRAVHEVSVS